MDGMSNAEMIEMQKKNCVFCKIISKEIPSTEIYSDDKALVILDINPANEGHMLILPKEHYQILPQIPESLIGHLTVLAKRASKCLLKSLGVQGTSVFIANGAVAGQKAPHFMIHVIPRKNGDMLLGLQKKQIDEKQLGELRAKISARLAQLTGKRPPSSKPPQAETRTVQAPKSEDNEGSGKEDHKVDIDKIANMFK